jgi:hypothetical protein
MSPTAASEAPTRPSLTDLAQIDPEQLLTDLQRALPGNPDRQPPVAGFQSSV